MTPSHAFCSLAPFCFALPLHLPLHPGLRTARPPPAVPSPRACPQGHFRASPSSPAVFPVGPLFEPVLCSTADPASFARARCSRSGTELALLFMQARWFASYFLLEFCSAAVPRPSRFRLVARFRPCCFLQPCTHPVGRWTWPCVSPFIRPPRVSPCASSPVSELLSFVPVPGPEPPPPPPRRCSIDP